MIRSVVRDNHSLCLIHGLPRREGDEHAAWLEINAPTPEDIVCLKQRFGIDTTRQAGTVSDDGAFMYMRAKLFRLGSNGMPSFGDATFMLGEQLVCRGMWTFWRVDIFFAILDLQIRKTVA